jgi:hypothetical protein
MVGACLVGASSVGGQHDSQPIVIDVFESVGQSADFFDDQVDGFGAAVADAVGVEVGQDLAFPGTKGAAQSGNLRYRTGMEAV